MNATFCLLEITRSEGSKESTRRINDGDRWDLSSTTQPNFNFRGLKVSIEGVFVMAKAARTRRQFHLSKMAARSTAILIQIRTRGRSYRALVVLEWYGTPWIGEIYFALRIFFFLNFQEQQRLTEIQNMSRAETSQLTGYWKQCCQDIEKKIEIN